MTLASPAQQPTDLNSSAYSFFEMQRKLPEGGTVSPASTGILQNGRIAG